MALTTIEQVEAVVGRFLTDILPRVNTLIVLASALVSDEMGYAVDPVPIPSEVTAVTTGVVARAIFNPSGATQDTTGPFSATWQGAQVGIYLTESERSRLARMLGGRRGLWTLGTTRGDVETTRWVYDQWGGEPIPFETI